jgi:hypothetical protein
MFRACLLYIFASSSLFSFGFNTIIFYGDLCLWKGSTFHTTVQNDSFYEETICLKPQKSSLPMSFGFRAGASYLMYGESLVFDANLNHFCAGKKEGCRFGMDLIDADIGYTFYRNYLIALRGFLGVEGAFLNKTIHQKNGFDLKESYDFKGVGPLVGLFFQWDMGAGFTFETLAAFASLFGQTKRDLNIYLSQSIRDCFSDRHFIGISDLRCGLRYTFPCLSWYGMGAFLGYEMRAILGNHVGSTHSIFLNTLLGEPLLKYQQNGGGKITLLQGATLSLEFSF